MLRQDFALFFGIVNGAIILLGGKVILAILLRMLYNIPKSSTRENISNQAVYFYAAVSICSLSSETFLFRGNF